MKLLSKKAKVLQRLVEKYGLRHGDYISLERLKSIAEKEEMKLKDLMIILGIKVEKSYEEAEETLKLKIKLYELEELENMGEAIFNAVQKWKKIGKEPLEYVSNEFKINEWVLNDILKKYINTNILLENSKRKLGVKKQIANEEKLLEEVKYRDFVTKDLIEEWKKQYKTGEKEICDILKVNTISFQNLMTGKTKKMRIDLIEEKEKKQIQEKIIQRCKTQDHICKQEIDELKKEMKTTDSILKETLSLSSVMFEQIMKDENKKARIILKDLKKRINILKLDIQYEYGERFYTSEELKKLCKTYKLSVKDFLRNLGRNVKRYPYLRQALQKNEQGIYIGKEHPISHEFAEKYIEKIRVLATIMTRKYFYYPYLKNEIEDMIQDACLLILEKGGCIEKNFGYNEDLMFSLFANKIKYYIFAKRNKEYTEILWEHLETFSETESVYELWNDEMMTELGEAKDERISIIQQKVMQILYHNRDYIFQNREKAYQLISYKLKIPLEYVERIIQEIGILCLEYSMVKVCKDGSIINMTDTYY